MVAAIAVTEPDAGSDVAGMRTRAVRDGDEWVINGTKLYITNGMQADWMCLLARTSGRGRLPGHEPDRACRPNVAGFSVSRKLDKLGQRSSDTAELTLRRRAGARGQHDRRDRPGLPAADGAVPERADDRGVHGRAATCGSRSTARSST